MPAGAFQRYGVLGWTGYQLTNKVIKPVITGAGRATLGTFTTLGRAAAPAATTLGGASIHVAQRMASITGRGIKAAPGYMQYGWQNRTALTSKYIRRPYSKYIAPRAAMAGKTAKFLTRAPVLSAAFIGYEVAQGKNLAEGIMRGGVEAAALTGGTIGAKIGAGIGFAFGGPIGGFIGMAAGGMIGYLGTRATAAMGLNTPQAPKFEDVFMNRRALTMRQASMMQLAKSSRAAFGNEAQLMHLR